MSLYAVRDGIFSCVTNGRIVILDLPSDRYLVIPDRLSAAFASVRDGRSHECTPDLLEPLIRNGLLEAVSLPRPSACASVLPPSSNLTCRSGRETAMAVVVYSLVAGAATMIIRRRLPFADQINLVRDRASKVGGRTRRRPLPISSIMASFQITGLLFSAHDQCVTRTIAAHQVCCRWGVRPTLVIGARLDPFAAHCWLQHDEIVLNDDHERVAQFTPILAV